MSNEEFSEGGGVAEAPVVPVADALVNVYSGLIFATTGELASHELNITPEQVALTPAVALRIAGVLREVLELEEHSEREAALGIWSSHEVALMPYGRVIMDESAVHFGIEPLGAGALVTVQWDHVPGLVASLVNAADWLVY